MASTNSSWGIEKVDGGVRLGFGLDGAESSATLTIQGAEALSGMLKTACQTQGPFMFKYQETSTSSSKVATAGPKKPGRKPKKGGKGC